MGVVALVLVTLIVVGLAIFVPALLLYWLYNWVAPQISPVAPFLGFWVICAIWVIIGVIGSAFHSSVSGK